MKQKWTTIKQQQQQRTSVVGFTFQKIWQRNQLSSEKNRPIGEKVGQIFHWKPDHLAGETYYYIRFVYVKENHKYKIIKTCLYTFVKLLDDEQQWNNN